MTKYEIKNSEVVECLNFMPDIDGFLEIIEPKKNAVIVQLAESQTEDGTSLKRTVSIECKDMGLYDSLKTEAMRILNLNNV